MKKIIIFGILLFSSVPLFSLNIKDVVGRYELYGSITNTTKTAEYRNEITKDPKILDSYLVNTIVIDQVENLDLIQLSILDVNDLGQEQLRNSQIILFYEQNQINNITFRYDHIQGRRFSPDPSYSFNFIDNRIYCFYDYDLLIFIKM